MSTQTRDAPLSDASEQAPVRAGALARIGGQISRDTLVYAVSMAMVFPFSLVQVAVLTRYLDPAEYGDLSLLLIAAGALTLLMSMGILQGTLLRTYGYGGDDDDDIDIVTVVDEDGPPRDVAQTLREKQTTLTTGVVLLFVLSVLITVPLIAAAPWVARVLLHDSSAGTLVTWACVSAAAGAVFRLTHNVLRMERRPYGFMAISALRPTLVVGLAALLVIQGLGVKGVLMATAAGTAAAALAAVAAAWRNYRAAIDLSTARAIISAGRGYMAFILALFLIHNLDTLLLSRFGSASDVGVYRVASRLASVPSYFVSAYLFAQAPIMRSTLMVAADEEVGRRQSRSLMLTYFIIAVLTIVLAISLAADLLVQIAAPSYAAAADLLPVLSLGFMAYGIFMVIYRSSAVGGRWLRVVLLVASLGIMVALAPILIPAFAGFGAALCTIVAMLFASSVIIWKAARADDPFEPQTARILTATALAIACWIVATKAPDGGKLGGAVVDVLAFMAFLILIVVFGAIPRPHLAVLRDVLAAAWRDLTGRHLVHAKLVDLPPRRRTVVEAIALGDRSAHQVAADEQISEAEVGTRLVRGLRPLAGRDAVGESQIDAQIGEYLLAPQVAAVRDQLGHRLVQDGVDPVELHDLATLLARLRRRARDVT